MVVIVVVIVVVVVVVVVVLTVCAKFCESDCRLRGAGKCDFKCHDNYMLDDKFECELIYIIEH